MLKVSSLVVFVMWFGCVSCVFSEELESQESETKQVVQKRKQERVASSAITSSERVKPKTVEIYQFLNPDHSSVLHESTQPVKKLPAPEIDNLIHTMNTAMVENLGAGISANQVGQSLQIFLIGKMPMVNRNAPYDVFINPVITSASKERSCFWHACLSLKDKKYGRVATWNTVVIEALDPLGNKFTRKLEGLDAIVAQHEFAHLLGRGYHQQAKDFETELDLMRKIMKGEIKMLESCDDSMPFILEGYQQGETIEEFSARQNRQKARG